VVDYITKPFDIQELRLRVRNSLRRAAQQTLVNPVTNVPEGQLVQEKLTDAINGTKDWALLTIGIHGLETFGDRYGFIASDDVLRAVTLMVNNAIREVGNESDFIGHLGPNEFIIVTDPEHLNGIRDRIEIRIKQSMEYFYPLKDRDEARRAMAENRLRLMVGQVLSSSGPYPDIDALNVAINANRHIEA
jgi:GGDEF domain-containing protein